MFKCQISRRRINNDRLDFISCDRTEAPVTRETRFGALKILQSLESRVLLHDRRDPVQLLFPARDRVDDGLQSSPTEENEFEFFFFLRFLTRRKFVAML